MRRSAAALVAVVVAGCLALLVLGLGREQQRVYTLGVMPAHVAVELRPGDTVCQAPVGLPDDAAFDAVALPLGTYGRPGPELRLTVRDARTDRVLGRSGVPAGYPDVAQMPELVIDVGRIAPSGPVEVCLENAGSRRVAPYGALGFTSTYTEAELNGELIETDLTLSFQRREARSLIAALPDALRHAAVFKAGVVTPLALGLLALLALVGVPALLAWGLLRAEREDEDATAA